MIFFWIKSRDNTKNNRDNTKDNNMGIVTTVNINRKSTGDKVNPVWKIGSDTIHVHKVVTLWSDIIHVDKSSYTMIRSHKSISKKLPIKIEGISWSPTGKRDDSIMFQLWQH